MASKCKYHNLVYGPQTIESNLQIYKTLVKFLDVQLGIMGAMVRQSSCPRIQDTMSLKLYRVIKLWMPFCTMKKGILIFFVMVYHINYNSLYNFLFIHLFLDFCSKLPKWQWYTKGNVHVKR